MLLGIKTINKASSVGRKLDANMRDSTNVYGRRNIGQPNPDCLIAPPAGGGQRFPWRWRLTVSSATATVLIDEALPDAALPGTTNKKATLRWLFQFAAYGIAASTH